MRAGPPTSAPAPAAAPTRGRTQAERRETTRAALLEAAARGLSRHGFTALRLEQVAADAGYTRGALYHLFDGKDDLAVAVIEWVHRTWEEELSFFGGDDSDPVRALVEMARGHALYCRRHADIARVMTALNVEFGARDHPVRDALRGVKAELVGRVSHLVSQGRRSGRIPPGPPVATLAHGIVGALEGLVIWTAGEAPHDTDLAERLMRGLLGVPGEDG